MSYKSKILARLPQSEDLLQTVAKLEQRQYISADVSRHIEDNLQQWLEDSEYALFNLGAHLAVGAVRYTVPLPLPIGSPARGAWVLGNKLFCAVTRNREKGRIHSWKVFFIAIIPFLGYCSYTIPIRETSDYLSYIYVQHICFRRKQKPLEEILAGTPRWIGQLLRRLLVPERQCLHKSDFVDNPSIVN